MECNSVGSTTWGMTDTYDEGGSDLSIGSALASTIVPRCAGNAIAMMATFTTACLFCCNGAKNAMLHQLYLNTNNDPLTATQHKAGPGSDV